MIIDVANPSIFNDGENINIFIIIGLVVLLIIIGVILYLVKRGKTSNEKK